MIFKLYFSKAVKNHIQKNRKLLLYKMLVLFMKNYLMAMKLDKKNGKK